MFDLCDFIQGSNPGIKQDLSVLEGKLVPVPCGLASLYSNEFFIVVDALL